MPKLIPEEILQRIQEEVARAKYQRAPESFRPPVHADFEPFTTVLAFDQTLNNCGWALVRAGQDKIVVAGSGTIRPPSLSAKVRGFEATFTKSVMIGRELRTLLEKTEGSWDRVVLELPALIGYRTESSLVAAVTICLALDGLGQPFPEFVSRQSAAATLCGSPSASKKVSSEVVESLVPYHPTGTGQWTEHVRDAVLVALKSLHGGRGER